MESNHIQQNTANTVNIDVSESESRNLLEKCACCGQQYCSMEERNVGRDEIVSDRRDSCKAYPIRDSESREGITSSTSAIMDSERVPLTAGAKENSVVGAGAANYDTFREEFKALDNSYVYCCHGNPMGTCCNEEEKRSRALSVSLHRGRGMSESHCHPADRDKGVDKSARKRLIFASILCLLFMIGEAVGGWLANSLAIASDAAHLLTDFASFMISLMSLWLAARPATKNMNFGWYRAEVIGALTSVLLIWVVTGILVYMAVQRVILKQYEIDAEVMLITAAVGVAVNIIMGVALQVGGVPHGHSHGGGGHSHGGDGHSHGGGGGHHAHDHNAEENGVIPNEKDHQSKSRTKKRAKKKEVNINVRAAFIHVLGDFLQSLGVLVAALIIYYKPDYGIVDPICTFLFSVLVMVTTFSIIKDVLNVLMEGMPKGIDFLEVQKTLLEIPGVIKVHNVRIWCLSLDKIALSAHLAMDKGQSPLHILKKASNEIRERFNIFDLTLQVEEYREEMRACSDCQPPQD